MTTPPVRRPATAAFFVRAVASFGLPPLAVALGVLSPVPSAFTPARRVRDRQETRGVTTRVDEARTGKPTTGHGPFDPRNLRAPAPRRTRCHRVRRGAGADGGGAWDG